ncbi:MAG: VanW family protein [Candidatus Spechtbacterales bacterium]
MVRAYRSISQLPRSWKIIVAVSVLSVGGFAVASTALGYQNAATPAIQGVSAGPVYLTPLSQEEALRQLALDAERFLASELTITVTNNAGTSVSASPNEMGVSLDIEETVRRAYARGREGFLLKRLAEQLYAIAFGIREPVRVNIDQRVFNAFVDTRLTQMHRPAQNTSLVFNPNTGEFDYIAAHSGTVVKLDVLRDELTRRAENISTEPILLVQRHQEAIVIERGIEAARVEALHILNGGSFELLTEDTQLDVAKKDMGAWIRFIPERADGNYRLAVHISADAIETYLDERASEFEREPTNAQFAVTGGKVRAFSLEQPGRKLNIAPSAQAIKAALERTERTATLSFTEIPASLTADDVETLGITTLLGSASTSFAGSVYGRVENIRVGSAKHNGTLLPPGGEFSFLENLGPITAAEGFRNSFVIKNGKIIPGFGGGLCQVSTTLFRAAVNAGLQLTERHPHSLALDIYGTPGFDAAIYRPGLDLKFRNNTSGYLLVQSRVVGSRVTFEVYGPNDGRTVRIQGPSVYQTSETGAKKAWLKQTVLDENNNVMEEQIFYSNYGSPYVEPAVVNPLE